MPRRFPASAFLCALSITQVSEGGMLCHHHEPMVAVCTLSNVFLFRSILMKILYINNLGSGFAAHTEVSQGTTVARFFADQLPDADPADYLIRVDRLPASADQVLTE